MTIARLHFSYAKPAEHAENIRRIREVSHKLRTKIKILQDLSGSKVRLGDLDRESIELKKGDIFTLASHPSKGGSIASINIPELISVIEVGDTVLLADGELELSAISRTAGEVKCRVVVGGKIKSREAVHVRGKAAPVSVPTRKDLEDVLFGIRHRVDLIAQSYATGAGEINHLRDFIKQQGAHIPIIAKIERRKALDNLDEVVQAADWVMVARGDLGLEIPLEEIALAQKAIIACANRAGKPAITATEMMFSMMEKNKPTRAEVSDVTNAILDGSQGVMLSGETAIGKFPIEATRMMARIAAVADAT
jgi:pyruvate kinase